MAEHTRTLHEVGSIPGLAVCRICGTEFDPSRYQVVVAELGDAPFDRIECADAALADRRRQTEALAAERAELAMRRRRKAAG